jgi:hypothetical protein
VKENEMNARIGHLVNLYGAMKAIERKRDKVQTELNTLIVGLSEVEMEDYLKSCEKIDAKHEALSY